MLAVKVPPQDAGFNEAALNSARKHPAHDSYYRKDGRFNEAALNSARKRGHVVVAESRLALQ